MVWRRYPYNSLWSEMEDMRAELDALFQLGPYRGRFLPPGELLTVCFRRYGENFVLMSGSTMMK